MSTFNGIKTYSEASGIQSMYNEIVYPLVFIKKIDEICVYMFLRKKYGTIMDYTSVFYMWGETVVMKNTFLVV